MTAIDSQPAVLPRRHREAGPAAGQGAAADTGTDTGTAAGPLPVPVILYLLCVVIPIGFQLGPLAMTTLRVLLLVMTVPLLVRLALGHFGRVYLTDILFVLHIGWATLALAINNPAQVVQQMGSVGIEFLGGYAMGRAYIRSTADFVRLARWLVVLVLCTLPFALVEAGTGHPPLIAFLQGLPGLTSVGIVTIEGRLGLERVQAVFAHPIHYGLFCSVAFSLSFVALKGLSNTGWRYASSALVAFSGLLALSSGAFLAILLQLGLIAWATVFASVRVRWWLLVGLFAILYVLIDLLSNRTPFLVFLSYATFSAHTAYWRSIIFEWGMVNVWRSPVFGIGLRDWIRPWFMNSASVDNFWLLMAMRYGIPGFVLLMAGYVLGLQRIMRRDFSAAPRLNLIRRAWVFTFLGLSFTLCTVHVWTNVYSFVFFMFGAGMWLIQVPATPDTGPAAGPDAEPDAGPDVGATGAAAPAGSRSGPRYSRFAPRRAGPPARTG